MADRNVTVKMSADVGQYKAAMADAQASGTKFEQATNRSLESVSVKMGKVGKEMTTKVTLPLMAVGAGAVKLAMDFDQSMAKITALVGIGANEVGLMRDAVLELSGTTATAPQELADALFVLTSAGLRGDDAMSALEASAKASAAGLGQTNDIARAVAGAMNAYGPGVLDAARATDVLTATARAGNFETSQLAGALGRVLPFAKQAGASFEDVGGAVALLTRTNGDAAQSITQVQALMRAFVTPTAEAVTVLGQLGLTAEDVRTSIGENGLASTLQMLDGRLDGNRETMGRLLGSSEGASAAFQILDADAETLASTFGVVNDAAGMTNDAFDTMADQGAFKLKQAWVDVQAALIEVGGIIGPIVADAAGVVSDLAGAFAELPPAAQTAIVVLGGLVAAAGPALVITSKLVTAYIQLNAAMAGTRFAGMGSQIASAAGPLGLLAVTVGAVAYGFATMGDKQQEAIAGLREITQLNLAEAAADMEALASAAQSLGDPVEAVAGKLRELALEAPDVSAAIAETGMSIEELAALMVDGKWTGVTAGFMRYTDAAGNAKVMTDDSVDAMMRLDSQARTLGRNFEDMAGVSDEVTSSAEAQAAAVDEGTGALEGHAEATGTAREQLELILAAQAEFTAAVLDSIAATFDHEKSTIALAQASQDLADKTYETNLIMMDSNRTDAEKAEALRNLRLEQIGVIEQALKTADAYSEETGASVGSAKQVQNQIDALIDLAAQHPELQGEIDTTIGKMLAVPGTVDSRVNLETAEAQRRASAIAASLARLQSKTITLTLRTVGSLPGINGAVPRHDGGPVRAGQLYEVGERNVAEMFVSGGRQYMIPGNDGNVIPGSKLTQAAPAAPAVSAAGGGSFPDPDVWGARAADAYSRRLQRNARAA